MDSYNYYLFDLDGTISESAPGIVKAVKYGLDQAGIHEEDAEKLHSFIGPPLNVQMKKTLRHDRRADRHRRHCL